MYKNTLNNWSHTTYPAKLCLTLSMLPAVVEQHREKYGLVQASELAANSARMKEETVNKNCIRDVPYLMFFPI